MAKIVYTLTEHHQTHNDIQTLHSYNSRVYRSKQLAISKMHHRYATLLNMLHLENEPIVSDEYNKRAELADINLKNEFYHLEVQETSLI